MVVTPWGDSGTLRGRRLSPGPGTPREEVERNQRERLYAAMVAAVAAKGYATTTVADLAKISGVSSRTFYDLFPDKRACFLATLEAMIEAAIAYAAREGGALIGGDARSAPGDWESQARRGFVAFAEMIVAQPAAARTALIESYAAGPDATARLEQAVGGFVWLARQALEASPERAGMPDEMLAAYIGAMREIASTRLRGGREAELPALMDDVWASIRGYRPPPGPLRLSGRPPVAREESLEAHDHAERALRAFAIVVAERGYEATTVDEVVRRGRMSATTFYANFRGKEDALMAAIDSAGAQMVAAVLPPFRRASDWPTAVRAGLGGLFNFLASRPALARLVTVEVYGAGPEAVQRRSESVAALGELMDEGRKLAPATPEIATEMIEGGIFTLAYRRTREEGPPGLPGLAPICAYMALSPFIGPQAAYEAAQGNGRSKR